MRHLPSFALMLGFSIFQLKAASIEFQQLSIDKALKKAKAENKFVFVDFYADWCRPCKYMEKEVFLNDSIAQLFQNHFVAIRVDAEKEQLDYVNSMGIQVYPTLAFYDAKGRLVYKKEGALSSSEFYDLSESLVHLEERYSDYNKNDERKYPVYNYVNSVNWINRKKALSVARKYLLTLKEKEYADSINWALISKYVMPWDRVMFPRVVNSKIPREEVPKKFGLYLNESMQRLLDYAIEKRNTNVLKSRKKYILQNAHVLPNADSLLLVGNLFYSQKHNSEEYPIHVEAYVRQYLPKDHTIYSRIAMELVRDYFQKAVLKLAIELAQESLEIHPNSSAYITLALANEKLLSYKKAYAYLLMAYEFVDESEWAALKELESRLKHKKELELASGVSLVDTLGTDGRFTLGAGTQRLMYGYPVPQSTSHFVINIDGKLASNSPFSSRVKHLLGQTVYEGSSSTPNVVTKFNFEDVVIVQSLIPVDKEGQAIERGLAQYYKVEYELFTKKVASKKIGLSILFDTMMDDNDACAIGARGHIIPYEYQFDGEGIPDELLFYRTPKDTSDLMGSAIIDQLEATRPDLLVVGRWPFLHKVEWQFKPRKVKYGDSAYMLRWQNKFLSSRSPLKFVTYYGLPHWKKPELRLVMKDDKGMLTSKATIFFENDKHTLDINAKMKIQEMIENDAIIITGVTLNGYADISGESTYNFELSKKRITAVGNVFTALGIPFVPKPYGFQHSEAHLFSQLYGNAFDRKVEIVMYYKLKNQGIALNQ